MDTDAPLSPSLDDAATLQEAENAIMDIMKSSESPGERRRAAEFIVEHHKTRFGASQAGVATKEDLERVREVIGENKEILERLSRDGLVTRLSERIG